MPVVATGLAGGRTGTRIVEELTEEAILNDFVRIRDESRTSTARRRPDLRARTPRSTSGARRSTEAELETLLDKLRYLSRRAELVVFAGSLPRGVDEAFYAEAARELTRRGVRVVLDTEGEPLRLGLEAEPWLVSPNQREAEQLVGQELEDDDGLPHGARRDRRAGRAQRADHTRERLLRARPGGAAGPPAPRGRARSSRPSRSSGRATCCSRSGSPRSAPGGPPRMRSRRRVAAGVGVGARGRRRALRPEEARRSSLGARRGRELQPASCGASVHGASIAVQRSASGRLPPAACSVAVPPTEPANLVATLDRDSGGLRARSGRKFGKEGLAFDDVLLVPAESEVLPNDVSTA